MKWPEEYKQQPWYIQLYLWLRLVCVWLRWIFHGALRFQGGTPIPLRDGKGREIPFYPFVDPVLRAMECAYRNNPNKLKREFRRLPTPPPPIDYT